MCHGQASGSSRSRKRQQLFRVFIPEDYVISDTVENMDNGDNQKQWTYFHFIIISQFSTDSAPSWPTPLGALPLPHPLTSAHPAAVPSAGL